MKFSLILATVNRRDELKCFLEHLMKQTYRNFELIVVDQNLDSRLKPILDYYSQAFPICHIKSEIKGASHARNLGLKYAKGDIISFPDDDCWYPDDLLEQVEAYFRKNAQIQVLMGRSVDKNMRNSHVNWDMKSGIVNRFNLWKRGLEFTMFLKSKVIEIVGRFDENLGPGTNLGGGEGADYILRALKNNIHIFYDPEIIVFHPQTALCYDKKTISRARSYGEAFGIVYRRHNYPFWFVSYQLFRSAGGIIVSLLSCKLEKAKFYFFSFYGKLKGWLSKEG